VYYSGNTTRTRVFLAGEVELVVAVGVLPAGGRVVEASGVANTRVEPGVVSPRRRVAVDPAGSEPVEPTVAQGRDLVQTEPVAALIRSVQLTARNLVGVSRV